MNSKEYRKHLKRNYKQFNVYLHKDEYEELCKYLKAKKLSKADLLRLVLKYLREQ